LLTEKFAIVENAYLSGEAASQSKVGYLCIRTPVEAIEALGAVPLRITPREGFGNGSHYGIKPDGCSFCRAIPALLKMDYYTGLKAIIGGACCDQMRRIMDTMAGSMNIPVILYGSPRIFDDGNEFYFREMEGAFLQLRQILGTDLQEDKLRERIAVRNNLRKQIQDLRKAGKLPTGLLHRIASSGFPEERIGEFLRENCLSADNHRVKLLLAGSIPGYWELGEIEASGAMVAADATCLGDRFFRNEVDERMEPLRSLYKYYVEDNICPHRRPQDKLLIYMKELAAERQIRGIVYLTLKYCHPWGLSHIRIKQEMGYPLVRIDDDLSSPAVGSFKTRVGAFVEMIKAQK